MKLDVHHTFLFLLTVTLFIAVWAYARENDRRIEHHHIRDCKVIAALASNQRFVLNEILRLDSAIRAEAQERMRLVLTDAALICD